MPDRRPWASFLAGGCAALAFLAAGLIWATGTQDEQQYYSFTTDGEAPNGLAHGRVIAGYDSANNRFRWMEVDADGALIPSAGGGGGPQLVPQAPVARTCDDTGGINFTAHANDVLVELVNESTAQDIYVLLGAVAGADRTATTGWSVRLGADAGSGASE